MPATDGSVGIRIRTGLTDLNQCADVTGHAACSTDVLGGTPVIVEISGYFDMQCPRHEWLGHARWDGSCGTPSLSSDYTVNVQSW